VYCVCLCYYVCVPLYVYVYMPFMCSASRDIALPAADHNAETCGVCQTTYFFGYEQDKLAQRESIYRELHAAVRNVIRHDRIHHSQSHSRAATVASSAASPDSKRPAASADGDPAAPDAPCHWQYGGGTMPPESVSGVCYGAVQSDMDKYAVLEDIAHNIVDETSARRLYEQYDDKTGLLVACRRSDRMIDESMNHHDFNATPVLLHCGHTVCRGCAYRCVRAHENARHDTMFAMVDCPMRCNRQTAFVCDLGVEWLPIDIRRIRLLQEQKQQQQQQLEQKSQQPMCSEHKDRVATARCTHAICGKFALMCEECDKAEHSARNTRDHVRVPPAAQPAAAVASSDSVCSTHQQPLTGVCVTDDTPICGDCVFSHSGHVFKRLHEVCCDWNTKLETLQRETLVRAHILSGRAASVQQQCDDMVSSINTHFNAVTHSVDARRNQLLFEVRKWRKMQLEESKMLAAESSQLSATAMYERMLLQQALAPLDEMKSSAKMKREKAQSASRTSSRRKSPQSSASSSSAAAAAAAATSSASASSSIATSASTVPDAVLGSVASHVHASGSSIEAQSVELNSGIAAMQSEDMSVAFRSATHASVLDRIRCMGEVDVRPVSIWTQGLASLPCHDNTSPSSRNSTKRKATPHSSVNQALSSSGQEQELNGQASSSAAAASSSAAASSEAGPSHKRRRRESQE
jgi:B-box zinc finger